ncbi:hypothetical protein HPB51_020327 [Rhipicephalus microplus]|uniref:Uncharacterized protein n=1 Tax=Rhipicephalus microplus TaxID=6941 RepID=A0A9J6EBP4_RHIMP|nr:hypothetical protein HPB51_020327 [Rhipicephalus microplus]
MADTGRCCKRGPKKNTSDAKPSTPPPLHATTVEWKSNFSISEMARLNIRGNEDEIKHADFRERLEHDTVLIEDPKDTTQLSREEAAATVIQRWARYEFKRWLRSAKAQHRSTETPLSSLRGIDYEDQGVVVNMTVEEDALARADKLKHSADEVFPIHTLPLGKRYSDVEDGGCVDA